MIDERRAPAKLARRPEPEAMDEGASVEAFHAQGQPGGVLFPLYHFNALALSRLLPEGGTLLDLGSGSGQFLAHMARLRPDIRVVGLELSPRMAKLGRDYLCHEGLSERVTLQVGDMTNFRRCISVRPHAISSIFSLHHLPNENDLRCVLDEIAASGRDRACSVWIFDHVRPRVASSADAFPEIFSPSAAEVFRNASRDSLLASFSFEWLSQALDETGMGEFRHSITGVLPMYQTHCLNRRLTPPESSLEADVPVSAADRLSALMFAVLLRVRFLQARDWQEKSGNRG